MSCCWAKGKKGRSGEKEKKKRVREGSRKGGCIFGKSFRHAGNRHGLKARL